MFQIADASHCTCFGKRCRQMKADKQRHSVTGVITSRSYQRQRQRQRQQQQR